MQADTTANFQTDYWLETYSEPSLTSKADFLGENS